MDTPYTELNLENILKFLSGKTIESITIGQHDVSQHTAVILKTTDGCYISCPIVPTGHVTGSLTDETVDKYGLRRPSLPS